VFALVLLTAHCPFSAEHEHWSAKRCIYCCGHCGTSGTPRFAFLQVNFTHYSLTPLRQPSPSLADEIGKLAKLKHDGVLDEAEFKQAKAKLLAPGLPGLMHLLFAADLQCLFGLCVCVARCDLRAVCIPRRGVGSAVVCVGAVLCYVLCVCDWVCTMMWCGFVAVRVIGTNAVR
jgi:hypothetical protein